MMTRSPRSSSSTPVDFARPLVRIFFLAAATLSLSVVATACKDRTTPEAKIQKVIDDGVAALEAGDNGAAADLLHDDYLDSRGRDRRKLKQLAFVLLRRGPVGVVVRDVKIVVGEKGDTAEAEFDAFAIQGKAEIEKLGDLVPQNAREFHVKLKLKLDGSDWLVTSLEGDGLGGGR